MALLAGVIVASTALGIIGSKMEGDAAEAAAAQEAEFFRQQAAFAQIVAEREAATFKRKADRVLAEQKLVTQANGIDMSQSSLGFLDDTYLEAQKQLSDIKIQGEFNKQLQLAKAESALEQGRAAKTQAKFNMLSSVLGGATDLTRAGAFKSSPKSGGSNIQLKG